MPRNKKKSSRRNSTTRKAKRAMRNKPKEIKSPKPPIAQNIAPAGVNRSAGLQQYKVAGRPSREEFQLVFGPRGHLMTWRQRSEAGVPAEKFQAALAAAMRKQAK